MWNIQGRKDVVPVFPTHQSSPSFLDRIFLITTVGCKTDRSIENNTPSTENALSLSIVGSGMTHRENGFIPRCQLSLGYPLMEQYARRRRRFLLPSRPDPSPTPHRPQSKPIIRQSTFFYWFHDQSAQNKKKSTKRNDNRGDDKEKRTKMKSITLNTYSE